MKALAAAFALLLAFHTAARATLAGTPFLATVTGTVTTQEIVGPGQTRIRTVPLDNARLCAAFGVSPHDHAVVIDTDSNGFTILALISKSAAGPVPVSVFNFSSFSTLLEDSKLNTARFQTTVTNNSATGLFGDFSANILGTFKYSVSNNVFTPTKVILSVSGNGTDTNGGTAGHSAVITFKVTSGKKFVQAP